MYEKILVPLDGSKVGEAALQNIEDLALKMAPVTSVEIILLQVVSLLTYNMLTDEEGAQIAYTKDEMKQIKGKSLAYLNNIAQTLRDKGLKVSTVVKAGHDAEEILSTAHEKKADLIAMSTHGRSGLLKWAMGSVTDKVLHQSDIPVLTVRARNIHS